MDQQETDRKKLLEKSKVVAIVGLSENEQKPSNVVARYLKAAGYRIIPVSLTTEEILGERSYRELDDIPGAIDIVDIFMRPEHLLPIVEKALKLRPKAIWLQLGIANEDARKLTENAGIFFVQDRCIKQEHARLVAGGKG
jgi:uncharacterized protein